VNPDLTFFLYTARDRAERLRAEAQRDRDARDAQPARRPRLSLTRVLARFRLPRLA